MGSSSTFHSPHSVSPQSMKKYTCYFYDQGHCKYREDQCLYSHNYYTTRVADGPVQTQAGRPSVAGTNATLAQPKYTSWRATTYPNAQRELQHQQNKDQRVASYSSRSNLGQPGLDHDENQYRQAFRSQTTPSPSIHYDEYAHNNAFYVPSFNHSTDIDRVHGDHSSRIFEDPGPNQPEAVRLAHNVAMGSHTEDRRSSMCGKNYSRFNPTNVLALNNSGRWPEDGGYQCNIGAVSKENKDLGNRTDLLATPQHRIQTSGHDTNEKKLTHPKHYHSYDQDTPPHSTRLPHLSPSKPSRHVDNQWIHSLDGTCRREGQYGYFAKADYPTEFSSFEKSLHHETAQDNALRIFTQNIDTAVADLRYQTQLYMKEANILFYIAHELPERPLTPISPDATSPPYGHPPNATERLLSAVQQIFKVVDMTDVVIRDLEDAKARAAQRLGGIAHQTMGRDGGF